MSFDLLTTFKAVSWLENLEKNNFETYYIPEVEHVQLIEQHERDTLTAISQNLVQVQKSLFGGIA
jgi:hypothetical protein